jgi:hypothetical protein
MLHKNSPIYFYFQYDEKRYPNKSKEQRLEAMRDAWNVSFTIELSCYRFSPLFLSWVLLSLLLLLLLFFI